MINGAVLGLNWKCFNSYKGTIVMSKEEFIKKYKNASIPIKEQLL